MDLGKGIQTHNAGFKLAESSGNPALMTICFHILMYYIRLILKNHQVFLIALWKVILLPISSLSMRMKPNLGCICLTLKLKVSTHYSSLKFLQGYVAKVMVLLIFRDFLVSVLLQHLTWTTGTPLKAACCCLSSSLQGSIRI